MNRKLFEKQIEREAAFFLAELQSDHTYNELRRLTQLTDQELSEYTGAAQRSLDRYRKEDKAPFAIIHLLALYAFRMVAPPYWRSQGMGFHRKNGTLFFEKYEFTTGEIQNMALQYARIRNLERRNRDLEQLIEGIEPSPTNSAIRAAPNVVEFRKMQK